MGIGPYTPDIGRASCVSEPNDDIETACGSGWSVRFGSRSWSRLSIRRCTAGWSLRLYVEETIVTLAQ